MITLFCWSFLTETTKPIKYFIQIHWQYRTENILFLFKVEDTSELNPSKLLLVSTYRFWDIFNKKNLFSSEGFALLLLRETSFLIDIWLFQCLSLSIAMNFCESNMIISDWNACKLTKWFYLAQALLRHLKIPASMHISPFLWCSCVLFLLTDVSFNLYFYDF